MIDTLLLAEDDALEQFVSTLTIRIAAEVGVEVRVRVRAAGGGFGGVQREAQRLARTWRAAVRRDQTSSSSRSTPTARGSRPAVN